MDTFWLLSVMICIAVNVIPAISQATNNSGVEEKLINDLLQSYHSMVMPPGGPTEIQLGLALVSFDFLDESNELVSVHGWLKQGWKDTRLAWDADKYDGIFVLRMPANHIWLPDIELFNGVSSAETFKSNVLLYNNGYIYRLVSLRHTLICRMNLLYFPYDQQTCSLKYGSWTYDEYKLNLTLMQESVDLADHNPSQDFILTSESTVRNAISYPCCPNEFYIDVTYTMSLQRYSKAYTAKLIIPSVLAGILILVTFMLPSGSSEKITFCGILFMIFVLLLIYLQSLVPASGDTILGEYFAFAIFVNFFATIIAVVSYNINTRVAGSEPGGMINAEGEDHIPKLPKAWISTNWLKYLDIGSFVFFTFVFVIGVATILGRRG